jgi:hypothetical protein
MVTDSKTMPSAYVLTGWRMSHDWLNSKPVQLITPTRTAEKTQFLCCSSTVSMGTYLSEKPFLCNVCCIFAYLAVVVRQRVHMLQYSFQIHTYTHKSRPTSFILDLCSLCSWATVVESAVPTIFTFTNRYNTRGLSCHRSPICSHTAQ